MIEQKIDAWTAAASAQALCITTNGTVKRNGQGVMGRGIAQEAMARFSNLPSLLGQSLLTHGNHVAGLLTITLPRDPAAVILLVALPVKHHWDEQADLALIARSLDELVMLTTLAQFTRVIVPRPGCGNGRLDWETQVKPLCAQALDDRFLVVHA